MRFQHKLGFFCILILVSPLFTSSQEHVKGVRNHKEQIHENQMSRKLLFEVKLHGFLLWASMGFLMPTLSLLLSTAGAVMSFRNFNNSFNNKHQRLGVGLYGLIWLQALIGIVRPQRDSRGRRMWFLVHWILGTAISVLGVLNIYTGLVAYHEKTSKGIKFWIIVFTAEVCFITFFYLFQEKWDYIQKQGLTLGNESKRATINQVVLPRDKQKEVALAETC
ncbi:hypothetical protein ACLB2K_058727 [Fragaria x ananassa]